MRRLKQLICIRNVWIGIDLTTRHEGLKRRADEATEQPDRHGSVLGNSYTHTHTHTRYDTIRYDTI